jgi:hypothetical protein
MYIGVTPVSYCIFFDRQNCSSICEPNIFFFHNYIYVLITLYRSSC